MRLHYAEPVRYRREDGDFKKAAGQLYEALAIVLRSSRDDETFDKAEKTIRSLSWVYFGTR
jgi:tRNA(Leu) C34 or U34 (ribose-2'-O)-methylase TrmL